MKIQNAHIFPGSWAFSLSISIWAISFESIDLIYLSHLSKLQLIKIVSQFVLSAAKRFKQTIEL